MLVQTTRFTTRFTAQCRVLRQCIRMNSNSSIQQHELAGVSLDPARPPEKHLEPQWAASIVHGRGVHLPYQHPRTHNIPVALIHFRSFFPHLLDLFTHFASHAASSLAIPISRPISLPTQRSLWTVPKGPFVHKKNQENFERKVHKRAIKAWDADPEVVERWIRYLESHALGGVGMRITRWERVQVGVGEERLKNVVEQMRLASVTNSDKVRALGEKIIEQETAAASEHPQIAQVSGINNKTDPPLTV